MDLRQLRYFVAVAERGSFSRAAADLHVAQSALSRHVQALEAELGATLLERGLRGVTTSAAGALLLDKGRYILGEMEALKSEVTARARELTGLVRLAAPGSLGEILYAPLARSLASAHPRLRLRLASALTEEAMAQVLSGSLDLALVSDPPASAHLDVIPLFREQVFLFGPPGAALPGGPAVSLADLIGLRMVRSVEFARRQTAQAELVRSFVGTVEVDSPASTKALVLAGLGHALLPYSALHDDLAAGRLVAAPVPELRPLRALVLPRARPQARAVQVVARQVRAELEALIGTGRILTAL